MLVSNYVRALNELSNYCKRTLAWIPRAAGYQEKEKSDELARTGSTIAFVGLEVMTKADKRVHEGIIAEIQD